MPYDFGINHNKLKRGLSARAASSDLSSQDHSPIKNNPQCPKVIEVRDLFLFAVFARVTLTNDQNFEFETVYDPDTNTIELEIPNEVLDFLFSDVQQGPRFCRYIEWLIQCAVGNLDLGVGVTGPRGATGPAGPGGGGGSGSGVTGPKGDTGPAGADGSDANNSEANDLDTGDQGSINSELDQADVSDDEIEASTDVAETIDAVSAEAEQSDDSEEDAGDDIVNEGSVKEAFNV